MFSSTKHAIKNTTIDTWRPWLVMVTAVGWIFSSVAPTYAGALAKQLSAEPDPAFVNLWLSANQPEIMEAGQDTRLQPTWIPVQPIGDGVDAALQRFGVHHFKGPLGNLLTALDYARSEGLPTRVQEILATTLTPSSTEVQRWIAKLGNPGAWTKEDFGHCLRAFDRHIQDLSRAAAELDNLTKGPVKAGVSVVRGVNDTGDVVGELAALLRESASDFQTRLVEARGLQRRLVSASGDSHTPQRIDPGNLPELLGCAAQSCPVWIVKQRMYGGETTLAPYSPHTGADRWLSGLHNVGLELETARVALAALIGNAREAATESPQLREETRLATRMRAQTMAQMLAGGRVGIVVQPLAEHVILHVVNVGRPFPAKIVELLARPPGTGSYSPLTTKRSGSGVGLPGAAGAFARSGAPVEIASHVRGGAIVRVQLPRMLSVLRSTNRHCEVAASAVGL